MADGGRWASYTRLSHAAEDGGSHAIQLRDCRRWVADIGGTIVLEEADDESGLVHSRPGYQRLLAAARAGKLDGIIVWRFDRLGRSLGESASRIEEFEARGIRVVSATEGDNPTTRDIMLALARDESRRNSIRVHPRQLEVARAGRMISRPPWGYRLDIDPDSPDPLRPRRRLVIHEPEAILYRELCRRFLAGASFQSLAVWLLSVGHRTYWQTVRGRLENPLYAGTLHWNRRRHSKFRGRGRNPTPEHVLVPDAAPAIVDAETHRAVAIELGRRRRDHGRSGAPAWPLTGLLYCACGRRMYGTDSTTRGRAPRYSYRCASKWGPEPCPFPQIVGPRLEWAILAAILVPLPAEDVERALVAARKAPPAPDLAARRREAEKRAELLKRHASALIDRLLDNTLTPEAYKGKAAEIEAERAALTIPEPSPPVAPVDLEGLRQILGAGVPMEGLSIEHRRHLFRMALERADWGGGDVAASWSPAFRALRGEDGRRLALPRRRMSGAYLDWAAHRERRD